MPDQDSNLNPGLQRAVCCHYTIGQKKARPIPPGVPGKPLRVPFPKRQTLKRYLPRRQIRNTKIKQATFPRRGQPVALIFQDLENNPQFFKVRRSSRNTRLSRGLTHAPHPNLSRSRPSATRPPGRAKNREREVWRTDLRDAHFFKPSAVTSVCGRDPTLPPPTCTHDGRSRANRSGLTSPPHLTIATPAAHSTTTILTGVGFWRFSEIGQRASISYR